MFKLFFAQEDQGLISDFLNDNTEYYLDSENVLEDENSEDSIYVLLNEQGYYVSSSDMDVAKKASRTNDTEIYMLDNGDFLSKTETNVYQIVEKINVNLYDVVSVNNILSNYRLSEFVRESINKQSSNAIETENKDVYAVIFVPKQSLGRASERSTYTYNGYSMMDETVYYYDVSTNYVTISNGVDTMLISKNVFDLGIMVGSEFTKYIGVVGKVAVGISAFQGFINATGRSPISGSHNDTIQVKINYDVKEKMTYVYENGWKTGCRSKQVKILNTNLLQYYFNTTGGKETNTYTTHNLTLQTENYLSPAKKAIQWRDNCWVEDISGRIYNHMVYFNL